MSPDALDTKTLRLGLSEQELQSYANARTSARVCIAMRRIDCYPRENHVRVLTQTRISRRNPALEAISHALAIM